MNDKNLAQILWLMPQVMFGKHTKAPGVKMLRAKEMQFASASVFYVHADGEMVGDRVDTVEVRMHAGALSVICGLG